MKRTIQCAPTAFFDPMVQMVQRSCAAILPGVAITVVPTARWDQSVEKLERLVGCWGEGDSFALALHMAFAFRGLFGVLKRSFSFPIRPNLRMTAIQHSIGRSSHLLILIWGWVAKRPHLVLASAFKDARLME